MSPFPPMTSIRQVFPRHLPLDTRAVLAHEWEPLRGKIRPGAKIAIAVGSRGITGLAEIVAETVRWLQAAGAAPFIIPAMGSHGGATPAGQTEVLATYGVTAEALGVPVRASLDVRRIGTSGHGVPVYCSEEALAADGIVIVNRVKPHTDFFSDTLGSGLLKMCVVGLGKRAGAAAMHGAAMRIGYETAIRGIAEVIEREAPLLAGVAIVEDQHHATARLRVVPRGRFAEEEAALLAEARRLLPLLPFEEIDLLVVDRIGKNISGAGLDPNVTGRAVHGYTTELGRLGRRAPFIRRIVVRDLTPETEGNASGLGLADVTTTRVVRALDARKTYLNALTSLSPNSAKIPIHFDTDREAIARALESLALDDPAGTARVVRIRNTLELSRLEVSTALLPEVRIQAAPSETRRTAARSQWEAG
ncbi:MAG: lactate racemase domain-containing protein [Opitutaceae bacterium]